MKVPRLYALLELPIKRVGFTKTGQVAYELAGMLDPDIVRSLSAHGLQQKSQIELSDGRVLEFGYVANG